MKKLNVQMYSLGHDNNDPFIKSFETLASFGYTGVEFAGSNYDGLSVEDMKAALANAGLEAVSSHVQLAKMEEDIPYMAALGAKMIICPMHAFKGVDEAKRFAEMLNKYGKIAAEYGMKVGYHNHTQEFWPTEGKPVLDYVIENHYEQPKNFFGVGGLKIFRDLIYQMQGLMRADHRFYKEHGFYDDFPQKHKGTIAGMYAVGAMMNNKKLQKKIGGKMTEGMAMPYEKVLREK